jgi:hypothetical protein
LALNFADIWFRRLSAEPKDSGVSMHDRDTLVTEEDWGREAWSVIRALFGLVFSSVNELGGSDRGAVLVTHPNSATISRPWLWGIFW